MITFVKQLYDSIISKVKTSDPKNYTEVMVESSPGSFVLFCERMILRFAGTIRTFSPKERLIFFFFLFILMGSILGLLWKVNRAFMIEVPARGGSLTEGVIGAPRFINPVLAISDTDRDLTTLVFGGLMRATPNGALIPDLAESYTISPDGLSYTFTLKEDLTWHNGQPITSQDIVFTILKIQDSVVKSPRRASWEGVSVEKINDRTVTFTLRQPYAPFLENTTLGIIPEHVWKNIPSEQFSFSTLNTEPIGSGPYTIRNIKKDSSGIPRYYDFVPFNNFALGRPFIASIRVRFYANEEELLDALTEGAVEAINAISTEHLTALPRESRIITFSLPRVFGVFFNQNQNALFAKKNIRAGLETAVDRDLIIQEILHGYGTAINGPLPPSSLGFQSIEPLKNSPDTSKAIAFFEKEGYLLNEQTGQREKKSKTRTENISFAISTSDASELKEVGEKLKTMWEALGLHVELKIFNTGDLNQNIIRPRKYDALLFGEIIGRESDPFAFWHSSQRNDPGLNIALYTNITTDKLLEKGRTEQAPEKRKEIYQEFEKGIKTDIPAIFLYSPDFIYIIPRHIRGLESGVITVPSERFLNVHSWYIETEYVWKIFTK